MVNDCGRKEDDEVGASPRIGHESCTIFTIFFTTTFWGQFKKIFTIIVLQEYLLFERLKTIAKVVNYTCKRLIDEGALGLV